MARIIEPNTAMHQRIAELYTDIEKLREYEHASSRKVKPAFRTLIKLCYKAIDQIVERNV